LKQGILLNRMEEKERQEVMQKCNRVYVVDADSESLILTLGVL